MNISIVGTGYVGLTTAVVLAYLGNEVTCIDTNPVVIDSLRDGRVPIYEPGLADLLEECRARMHFVTALQDGLQFSDVVFICVGTPSLPDGSVDLHYVESVAAAIGESLPEACDTVIVNKSTVPVGTGRLVESRIRKALRERKVYGAVSIASNPEFLREGSALLDSLYPDRIVVGSSSTVAVERLRELYRPILEGSFPPRNGVCRPNGHELPAFVATELVSAELAKYAANAFLAMKISFANEIAGLAELVGADIMDVMQIVGLDNRIGPRFLAAGAGWGGSCFGKDVRGLISLAGQYGHDMPLSEGTMKVNLRQRQVVAKKLLEHLKVLRGQRIAIWGVTFKPNTDDLRDSPAIDVIRGLCEQGATVAVFDPVGMQGARTSLKGLDVEFASSPIEAASRADALVLMTEWDVFLKIDWHSIAGVLNNRLVIDMRNAFDRDRVAEAGLHYVGVGR